MPQKQKPQTVLERSSFSSAVSLPSGSTSLPAPSAPNSFPANTLRNKAKRNPKNNPTQQHNQIPQKTNAFNRTPKFQLLECRQLAERLRQHPCSFSIYAVP